MSLGSLYQFCYSPLAKGVLLTAIVKFDANGVATLEAWTPSSGSAAGTYAATTQGQACIASVAAGVGTGEYVFTLAGSAERCVGVDADFVYADVATNVTLRIHTVEQIDAGATTPAAFLGSDGKTIDVCCYGIAAGAFVNLAPKNCTGRFHFYVSDSSSLPRGG